MTKINVLLKLENIKKIYPLDGVIVEALKDITLTFYKGEMVSIMGPSGSGKSTLMHIIGCLDRPSSGTIKLKGRDIGKLSDNELAEIRNKQIGFIFQSYNLLPRATALDNVGLPLIYAGVADKKREELAKNKLEEVGLADRIYHKPNQLSGGQQQRVAIARALINNPDIILADEPTGNLDTKSGRDIINLLKKLNKQGRTIIMVTHDHNIAREAQRIVKIQDGEILIE